MSLMIDTDVEDLLVDSLNNYNFTMDSKTYIVPSVRGNETISFKGGGITVYFETNFSPYKRFLGEIIGKYPDRTYTFNGQNYTISGKPIRGYPVLTKVYISTHAVEKKLRGVDGDKFASKLMNEMIIKIKKEWPTLLATYKAELMGPIGVKSAVPMKISGEWIYRYTIRFDIISSFVFSTPPTDPTEGIILGVDGTLKNTTTNKTVREFTTER